MTELGHIDHTLNTGDPILKRSSRDLGQSWIGVEGTLAGPTYRIHIPVRFSLRQTVTVCFPIQQTQEEQP